MAHEKRGFSFEFPMTSIDSGDGFFGGKPDVCGGAIEHGDRIVRRNVPGADKFCPWQGPSDPDAASVRSLFGSLCGATA